MIATQPFFQALMVGYFGIRLLGAWNLSKDELWLVWREDGEVTKAKRFRALTSYCVIGFEISVLHLGGFFTW